MQNKKLIIVIGLAFVVVAVSAFVGGRLLNGSGLGPLGSMLFKPDLQRGVSIDLLPAPELPQTSSDLTGLFVGRQGNILTILSLPAKGEGVGVAVIRNANEDDSPVPTLSAAMSKGPRTEVVITGKTIIYHDTTQPPDPSSSGQETIKLQQTVEEGTLDDLQSQTMMQIWGRKNGDRLIADILIYSTPVTIIQK